MRCVLLLAAVGGALALAGCADKPPRLKPERSYVLEWIGDRPLIDNSHVTLTLGDDGRAYGNAGCNHWFAPYTLHHHTLTFGEVGHTRKLCAPALMEQENRFVAALETVKRWDVSPTQQIRLWPEQGEPLRLWPEEE
ncbi:MAG: META domain-containing protein [Pseudomonas sp.]|nr:META domain-containing protein [Pseudomonas sp. PIA16]MDE1169020.1 META domain-containing protein [Pseudomonas sp.]